MTDRRTSEERDLATLEAIGRIYCDAHHADSPKDEGHLCPDCRKAVMATLERATACPNGHTGNCQDCDIKCQRGQAQERIKEMMRYSAPRMAFRHPVMTLEYLRKKFKT